MRKAILSTEEGASSLSVLTGSQTAHGHPGESRNVSRRGPASGLFAKLLFTVVAAFVARLMIGRTPEYLARKLEGNEIKTTMVVLLTVPAFIQVLTAAATVVPAGRAGLTNNGPRGFSELL